MLHTAVSRISEDEARVLAARSSAGSLMPRAAALRDAGHGNIITYSKKVFIPLTHLCRDSCHYCTFSAPPRKDKPPFMSLDEVLEVVRAGENAGCTEALFTLGDKPEMRYAQAQIALREFGYSTTLAYLRDVASAVATRSRMLPHLNPGVMSYNDLLSLRPVAASMGLMLESISDRLTTRGHVHFGSPDKNPTQRLATIQDAGKLRIPFTTGLLVGIGETRQERVESLLALRALHDTYGHIQEIIIQPFRAKRATRMANHPDAPPEELLWTIAIARLIFGPEMNIQAPPNLALELIDPIIGSGINDWGGISPVTPDFVNPEAPWPHLDWLAHRMSSAGRVLVPRLPIYPKYAHDRNRWLDPSIHRQVLWASDSEGLARDTAWTPGQNTVPLPALPVTSANRRSIELERILNRSVAGEELSESEIVQLFAARGDDFHAVCAAADELRARVAHDTVRYVVNRNINYTNMCVYRCGFCAFSKGKTAEHLRGAAYDLDAHEIGRRVREAWDRGATEVCMQGGIHPDYTGATYLNVIRVAKDAVPAIHVHAFSPLEVVHGATTLGLSIGDFLRRLRDEGLGTLPGTAAEILDDEVREVICPDKLRTSEWIEVVETAHRVGLRTTATIMFGHVEHPGHWARHLLSIRRLQGRTGGFTEFVPLPFVHMEAPIYFNGRTRRGPTWRETILMHAVSRLVLNPLIANIQTSWVKLGADGAKACLRAGANDLGGTLMNESISRAAGAAHGQEFPPASMDELIRSIGRAPAQRNTLYAAVPESRRQAAYSAGALTSVVQTPPTRPARLLERPSVSRASTQV